VIKTDVELMGWDKINCRRKGLKSVMFTINQSNMFNSLLKLVDCGGTVLVSEPDSWKNRGVGPIRSAPAFQAHGTAYLPDPISDFSEGLVPRVARYTAACCN